MAGERRASKRLSAIKLAGPLEAGKYHDGGSLGLYLRVEPKGQRYWIQRITIKGKRTELGLGSYPMISLADARAKATENKRTAFAGGSPLDVKRKAKDVLTFSQAMEIYLAKKGAEHSNEKHRKQWLSTLQTYAVPVFGDMRVDSIETRHILRALEPIWATKTETATRVRGRIEAVLSWATVAGHRTGDNPARWGGNLAELLPKPNKVADKDHQPAVALADVSRWFKTLRAREGMAAQALQFLTLCLSRSGEVRGMTWSEVDLGDENGQGALWVVPAERMKAKKEHRVPLIKAAVELLRSLPRDPDSPYVFFSPKGGKFSDMALSAVMRRIQSDEIARLDQIETSAGRKPSQEPRGFIDPRSKRAAVPHGLRSTYRDWSAEEGIDRDLAEMALAHNVGSAVERAYRRTDMMERRRNLLESWGNFLNQRKGENILPYQRQG